MVTGPSGAGKSSLAFDTVYAEGQRRFVESMSTYARQFLDQMERPPVDDIRHILPAVALEARNAVRNARSTVGTITEVHDVLRLLFTHLGEVHCPRGHGPARRFTAEEAARELAGRRGRRALPPPGARRPRRRARRTPRSRSSSARASRAASTAPRCGAWSPGERWPAALDPLPLVLGRFQAGGEARRGCRARSRRATGWAAAGWRRQAESGASAHYARELGCPVCGEGFRQPTPALFSFNSPLGACPACQGFGRVVGIDRERVIPDPSRPLAERPIAPWNTPAYEELYAPLLRAARRRRIPLDVPWRELPEAARRWVWSGEARERDFCNLEEFFAWLEQRTYKVHVRVLLARYRSYTPCPDCGGGRLQPEALAVRLRGETLAQLQSRSVEQLRAWLREQRFSAAPARAGGTPARRARASGSRCCTASVSTT